MGKLPNMDVCTINDEDIVMVDLEVLIRNYAEHDTLAVVVYKRTAYCHVYENFISGSIIDEGTSHEMISSTERDTIRAG